MDFSIVNTAIVANFGEALSFEPRVSAPITPAYSISGVFSRGTGIAEDSNPLAARVLALTSAFDTAPVAGDVITRGDSIYRVLSADPDELGSSYTLVLEKT